jgi:hypothetical protein
MIQTLISLLTLPLKVEYIQHMNPTLKIQANEKQVEKHTLTLPLKLEQLEVHNTNNKIIK